KEDSMKGGKFVSIRQYLVGLFLSTTLICPPLFAGESTAAFDVAQISKLDADQLEQLFRTGSANGPPIGDYKGRPLLMLDGRHPRMRAAINGVVWKGKRFRDDGTMINRWLGFRAVESTVDLAPSTLDGEPCVRLDYAPNAPIFGNAFDELREIA